MDTRRSESKGNVIECRAANGRPGGGRKGRPYDDVAVSTAPHSGFGAASTQAAAA